MIPRPTHLSLRRWEKFSLFLLRLYCINSYEILSRLCSHFCPMFNARESVDAYLIISCVHSLFLLTELFYYPNGINEWLNFPCRMESPRGKHPPEDTGSQGRKGWISGRHLDPRQKRVAAPVSRAHQWQSPGRQRVTTGLFSDRPVLAGPYASSVADSLMTLKNVTSPIKAHETKFLFSVL